jgi:antagonist of KipI
MGMRIIKAGILDTVQDAGRYGYQHLGINPGGVMDHFVMEVVNSLVDNGAGDPVLEIHFPAPNILFQQQALIAIGGADFNAAVNGEPVPLYHPVLVNKNCLLQFQKQTSGARVYIAIREKISATKWLNSYSTNLKAVAGGFHGRSLKKDDVLDFIHEFNYDKYLEDKDLFVLPWKTDTRWDETPANEIMVVKGNEWSWLNEDSQGVFLNHSFYISNFSDRMGYLMVGQTLAVKEKKELVSSAVSFGTIQLLPDGQMIILMADHQTTGGFPRIAHVIIPHLSKLAQMNAGTEMKFRFTDQETAEELLIKRNHHLQHLQNACKLKLSSFLV